jgi:hypothetical protein
MIAFPAGIRREMGKIIDDLALSRCRASDQEENIQRGFHHEKRKLVVVKLK